MKSFIAIYNDYNDKQRNKFEYILLIMYFFLDLEPLCSTMSQHVNNALSVESGFMENNWQDNQKIQMQNQVNIWNSMMYRYWKLQSQQHLIPHYRNAWLRRMSYEVNPASHSGNVSSMYQSHVDC